jgi:hypothetical protein
MMSMTFQEWVRIQQIYYHITSNVLGELFLTLAVAYPYFYIKYRKECKL